MLQNNTTKTVVVDENYFYSMFESAEKTNILYESGYYPTVTELKKYDVENNVGKYLPMLIFYANDPFNDEERKNEKGSEPKYIEMVKYVNKILKEKVIIKDS